MKRMKITLFWCAGILAVILLIAQYVVPKLMNSDLLKSGIETALAEEIGGDVSFREIELTVIPRPHAAIHKGSVNTETVRGTLKSLHLYPRFFPLLIGKLRISKLVVNAPDISLRLPSPDKGGRKEMKNAGGDAFSKASAMTDSLASRFPGLTVNIRKGNLHIIKDNGESYKLSGIYSHIAFPSPGHRQMEAELDSSGLHCTFQREGKTVIINASDLKAAISLRDNQFMVSLKEMILDHPRLNLFSELIMDGDARLMNLTVGARNTDVPSTRETALLLGGHIPVMEKIFQIIRGGHIPSITFRSDGEAFRDLDDTENFVIEGEMEHGDLHIPGVDLALKGVSGDVEVVKGILYGQGLEANWEDSQAEKGSLKIGLEGEDAPFHLDMMVEADLVPVQRLLKRLVNNQTFVDELSLIENLQGRAKGRLILGESLKSVHAHVEADDVTLSADYERIPYPIDISTDTFTYDETGITIKNMRGSAGSTSVSGLDFRIEFQEKPFLTISAGSADIIIDETYPWFSELAHLPSDSHLLSPLSVESMSLVWDRGDRTLLQGDLFIENGTEISFDIAGSRKGLEIKKLSLSDDESDADMGLTLGEHEVDIRFEGELTESTVDKLIVDNTVLMGWLKGEFQARIDTDLPRNSTAEGLLEGMGIEIPLKNEKTASINRIKLEGQGRALNVFDADIMLGKTGCLLSGSVSAADDSYLFNGDLSAGKLDFQALKEFFEGEGKGRHDEPFYRLPFQGTFAIDAESFTYGNFLWTGLKADMKVSADRINIEVNKSDLCTIAFPGRVAFTPQEVSLAFQPSAENSDIKTVVTCLWNTDGHITGSYDVESHFEGAGRGDEIIESLKGDLTVSARRGRIFKGGILSKVFEFINVTEILRGATPDFTQEGFSYTTIEGTSEIKGSTLHIEKVHIDGSSMNIVAQGTVGLESNKVDLELLLAPMKTADFLLQKIPLLKEVTQGTLVTIPLKVTGTVDEPVITYNPVEAVGKGIINILKGTLQAPFKIIHPELSEEE